MLLCFRVLPGLLQLTTTDILSSHVMVVCVTFIPNYLQKQLITPIFSIAFFKMVNSVPKAEVKHEDYIFTNQFAGVLPSNIIKPDINLPGTLQFP